MIKKVTSVLMVFILSILMLQGSITHANDTNTLLNNIILEYTIMNEDGTIEETGIVPNNRVARYSWPGVTLKNKQYANFRAKDGGSTNGLYCLKDIPMKIKYTLDRHAYAEMRVYKNTSTGDVTATYYLQQTKEFEETYKAPVSAPYWLKLTNYSSDPITITLISLEF